MKNYNLDSPELHLNLQLRRVPFVSDLTTAEVSNTIKLVAKQDIPAKDVLKFAKKGELRVLYVHGTLTFTILKTGKSGERYRLRGEIIPNCYTSA